MKYLIILLLFYGCGSDTRFYVKTIESTKSNECNYRVYQVGSVPPESFIITDSCGKYQVGDTLKLVKK